MNNQPSKHHFIPVCYLKQFLNSQKLLWRRRKENKKVSPCTPQQVCYRIDLYKIKHEDTLLINKLTDQHYIEKNAFKRQENLYFKCLSTITVYSQTPRFIEKANYKLFIEFLITLKRRNPVTRDFMMTAMVETLKKDLGNKPFIEFLKHRSNNVGENLDVEHYLKDYLKHILNEPDRINDIYLNIFLERNDSILNSVTKTLLEFKQFILMAPIGDEFITSDNPGFIKHNNTLISFGGLVHPFKFYFPLTPSFCLFIDSNQRESISVLDRTVYPRIITKSETNEINSGTLLLSNKIALSRSENILLNLG